MTKNLDVRPAFRAEIDTVLASLGIDSVAFKKLNMDGMNAKDMTLRQWLEFYFEKFGGSWIMRTEVQRQHKVKRFRLVAIKTGLELFQTENVVEAIKTLVEIEGQFRPIPSDVRNASCAGL